MSTVFNGSCLQNKVVLITGASGGIGAVGNTASFTLEITLNISWINSIAGCGNPFCSSELIYGCSLAISLNPSLNLSW
jgi:hypothetical protein